MNERLHHKDTGEKIDIHVELKNNLENAQEKASHSPETSAEQLAAIRHKVESNAISGKEITVGEHKTAPSHSFGTHKQLKFLSYKRTLAFIQSRLNRPEKAFSKTIHNRGLERASNIGAATVARPQGILFGGLLAFVGSCFYLYLAKRYGFSYNFSVFILLFITGYVLASLLEIVVRIFKRR